MASSSSSGKLSGLSADGELGGSDRTGPWPVGGDGSRRLGFEPGLQCQVNSFLLGRKRLVQRPEVDASGPSADPEALATFAHRKNPAWQSTSGVATADFAERLRLLEEAGADAVILHARFIEERFKRRARHELFPWAASLTRLPLIANGDLTGPDTLMERADCFQSVSAIMLGRMAVARPWIFSTWDQPANVDFAAIWEQDVSLHNRGLPARPWLCAGCKCLPSILRPISSSATNSMSTWHGLQRCRRSESARMPFFRAAQLRWPSPRSLVYDRSETVKIRPGPGE